MEEEIPVIHEQEEQGTEQNENEEAPSPTVEGKNSDPKRVRGRPKKPGKSSQAAMKQVPVAEHPPLFLEPLFDFSGFHVDNVLTDIPLLPMIDSGHPPSDISCEICMKGDNEDKLVLCDKCDKGYHLYCLPEPLENVPQGTWYCEKCVQPVMSVHTLSLEAKGKKQPKAKKKLHM